MPASAAAAHASALLTMPAHSPVALMAFWFSGERESGPQVQIAASALDRASGTWSTPRFVVNRHVLTQQLGAGVRRLGNPVAWLDAQQRIHLFVVGTGWGGWGASRIVHLQQTDANTAADTRSTSEERSCSMGMAFHSSKRVAAFRCCFLAYAPSSTMETMMSVVVTLHNFAGG